LHKAWLHHYKGSSAKPRLTFLIEPAEISGVFSTILTNYWKIYKSLYSHFLSFTGKRQRPAYREFLEALIKLLFLCNSEEYTENIPGTSFKEYPKYSYIPYKPGPKPRFPESASPDLTDISRKTPFIFKGDPGHPRVSIPAKITPISLHQHIKTTIRG
jgi:hypothetical protein